MALIITNPEEAVVYFDYEAITDGQLPACNTTDSVAACH